MIDAPLRDELKHYLEQLAEQLAQLPAYYPPGVTFASLDQPSSIEFSVEALIGLRGWFDEERQPLRPDPALTEVARRAGYTHTIGNPRRTSVPHTLKKEPQRSVLLGDAGAGKSWWLHAEGLQAARRYLARLQQQGQPPPAVPLPVYLPLRALAEEIEQETNGTTPFVDALLRLLERDYAFSPPMLRWMQQLLSTRQALLLLDSLDEVAPGGVAHLLNELQRFAQSSRASIVVTSRPAAYHGRPFLPLRGWGWDTQEVALVDFTWSQVRGFVLAWFGPQRERGEHLLASLRGEPALMAIARMPFFLPLLCLLGERQKPLLARRAPLYEAMLGALPNGQEELLHPAFQDYLVARSLAQLPFERCWKRIKDHLWYDADWQDRLLLLAGCLPDPNPLLEALLAQEQDIFHQVLLLAGRCLAEAERTRVRPELAQRIRKQLFALLASDAGEEREQAEEVLVRIAQPDMVTRYITWAHNEQEEGRRRERAIRILGQMGDASVVPALLHIYQETALKAAWGWMRTVAEALEELEVPAVVPLRELGLQKTAELLFPTMQADDTALIEALGQMTRETLLRSLLAALNDRTRPAETRQSAVRMLGSMKDARAVESLLAVFQEGPTEPGIAYLWQEAAVWLGHIGDGCAVDGLLEALYMCADRYNVPANERTLGVLVGILGNMESQTAQDAVREAFVQLVVSKPDPQMTLWTLRQFFDVESIRDMPLEALLSHPSPVIRDEVLWEWGRRGDERALDFLLARLQRQTTDELWSVTDALACIGGSRATKGLLARLHASKHRQALYAEVQVVNALRTIGGKQVADGLLQMLHAGETTLSIRETAAEVLGALGDPRGVEIARELLYSARGIDNGANTAIVLCMLARRGDEQALEVLRSALLEEGPVRTMAVIGCRFSALPAGRGLDLVAYWNHLWFARDESGVYKRTVSKEALEHLLRYNDPRDLCIEVLTHWPQIPSFMEEQAFGIEVARPMSNATRKIDTYDLLASCAPLLRQVAGEEWPQWRSHLMRLDQEKGSGEK